MPLRVFSKSLQLINLHSNVCKNSVPILPPLCACVQQKFLSSKLDATTTEGEVPKKKKTAIIPKITLISGNDLSVTTLENAQNLAKRRDLKLVKILDFDTKTQRPIYKLMSGAEFYQEDLKQREKKKQDKQNTYIKGEKVLLLNSKISRHDLETNINKCRKWLGKMYEIKVVINGETEPSEKIYEKFESELKADEARFLQKRVKGSDMKFQILPHKKAKSEEKPL